MQLHTTVNYVAAGTLATRKDKMLGDLLRNKREDLGYTQDDVSKLVGCSRASIAKFEAGQYLPSLFLCHKLFKALHLNQFTKMAARIMAGK